MRLFLIFRLYLRPEVPDRLDPPSGLPVRIHPQDAPLTRSFASYGDGCFLERSLKVVVLPLPIPFVAQIPGTECGKDIGITNTMRERVNGISQIHPRAVASIPGIRAELFDSLEGCAARHAVRPYGCADPGSFRAILIQLSDYAAREFDSFLVLGSAAVHEADEWIQAVFAFVLALAIRVARSRPK